ncbi:MAG: hypothetical protein HOC74_04050 [Gemmatimonadetes bacterium]|jgi:hypothetical protein|nr:hypothetical protein [Gemmatimonadota bacterium]
MAFIRSSRFSFAFQIVFFISTIALWGCGDDEDNPVGSGIAEWEKADGARFPLAVGNRWVYAARSSWIDQLNQEFSTAEETEVILEITAEEEVFGQKAFRLEITHHLKSKRDTVRARTWFAMVGDSLIGLGSAGDIGRLEPLYGQLFKPVVQGESTGWGAVALVFPLKTGKSWSFLRKGGDVSPLAERRKIVKGKEQISVPAGEFDTFRVVDDLKGVEGQRGEITQWFSTAGLVKYEEDIKSYGIQTDEQGVPIEGQEQLLNQSISSMELVEVVLKGK